MSAAEFVFRHAGGCLLESPDLDPRHVTDVENWAWVATIWTDQRRPTGWGVLEWTQVTRGWAIPATTTLGDVIEFGVGALDAAGDTRFDRWWGWISRLTQRALVVVGPFAHPSDAESDARAAVDVVRIGQLDAPDVADAVAALLGSDLLD